MSRFLCIAIVLLFCSGAEAQMDFFKNVKLGGFVIGRYRLDETSSLNKSLQDVQNAKLKLYGELGKNLRFTLQHDFAPNNWQGLLNIASLTWDLNSSLTLTLGKQFIPFGLENDIGSYGLKTTNFSNIYSLLVSPLFVDNAIVFNFTGGSTRKIWLTALEGNALVAGTAGSPQIIDYAFRYLQTIASGSWRFSPGLSIFYGESGSEKKINAELSITDGAMEIQGEILLGQTAGKISSGAYLLASRKLSSFIEPAFKYDYYDPDTITAGDETNTYTAALNIYLLNLYRLQTAYQVIDETGTELANNKLVARLSAKF